MARRRPKGTGAVRRLPSGRWQARIDNGAGVLVSLGSYATKTDAAYVKRVSSRVAEELARRVDTLRRNGHKAADLGDPDELADRMLAAVPAPSPWRDLGPFYGTSGLARVLGGVSRQAIEERRRR